MHFLQNGVTPILPVNNRHYQHIQHNKPREPIAQHRKKEDGGNEMLVVLGVEEGRCEDVCNAPKKQGSDIACPVSLGILALQRKNRMIHLVEKVKEHLPVLPTLSLPNERITHYQQDM